VLATKKPVTITAVLWDGSSSEAYNIIEWVREHGGNARYKEANESPDHKPRIEIVTLEGILAASPGDWIIQGVKDEFYPCKPDIFDQTYNYPSPE
jgi:hypothetical protein